jgi:hypothetical protein
MPANIPLHPADGIFTVERFFGIQEPSKGNGSEPGAQSASEDAVAGLLVIVWSSLRLAAIR